MSSTLIAFIFGSVFNLLTRRFEVVPIEEEEETSDRTGDGASGSGGKSDTQLL